MYNPIRNDPLIQRYNPVITSIWRANTDFSRIISQTAVLKYIAKYAAKSEKASKDYNQLMKDIFSKVNDDQPAKSAITRLFIAALGERDYSAQEVFHLLMGWPMHHSSRQFITLLVGINEWEKLEVRMTLLVTVLNY